MPCLRGTDPTRSAQFTPLKPSLRSAVGTTPLQQRKSAVIEFHHHALQRGQRRFDLHQVQDDRLVRAEHGSGGDPKEEGISDLPGRAGDRYTNGGVHKFDWDQVVRA
jgi:hypothetical protein